MNTKLTKRDTSPARSGGRYVWRDSETGQFKEVRILKPAKGPSSTSAAAIRRAVKKVASRQKAK